MFEMLNRVCWNTSGWRLPTYAAVDGGYVNKMGFGFEEWNFQTEDAVDGYVFGYLKYNPSPATREEAGGHFKIGFWTIQPESGARLLIGIYHDSTLATESDHAALQEEFLRRGILERRINELLAAVPRLDPTMIRQELSSATPSVFNFKCPVDQVEVLRIPVPVPSHFGGKSLGLRFTNPTFAPIPNVVEYYLEPGHGVSESSGRFFPHWQDGYYREVGASLKYIEPRHSQLAANFGLWLKENGFREVIWEKARVDIEFEGKNGLSRAELKICHKVGTTKSIREALGQLFEYNYYGGREPANQWLIVLDKAPLPEDLAYVERLNSELKLPLILGWSTEDTFEFSQPI